ncbi:intra-flagellar transport protein 57, partial [Chytridium lagenaria]
HYRQLKLLNYLPDFCQTASNPSTPKHYFLVPSTNPNEQFFYFTSLFTWLLSKIGVGFEAPGQFDDPNASAANIANELKKMGVPFEYGPHKLKQGHGEAIVYTLQILTDRALQLSSFTFQKPVHKVDEKPKWMLDAEITLDAIEERVAVDDGEDEMFVEMRGAKVEEIKPQVIIKPTMEPAEWKLEVERVTPMLKLIAGTLTDTQTQLTKLHHEVEKTLEKITSREKYINAQFEHQIEEQRALQDQVSELRQKYNLTRISEELDAVKSRMDEIGNGMTDSTPLVNIKQGVQRLKVWISDDWVIEHTLLQAKLKNKGPMLAMPAFNAASFLI